MFTKSYLGKPHEESELKLGDRILTTEKFIRTCPTLNKIVWIETTITATGVMFLGYTNVYDGVINPAFEDWESDFKEPPSFIQTKTHRVMVVQPTLGTRYTKPFYILSEQQKMGYWSTTESSAKQKEMESRQQKRLDEIKDVLGLK